MNDKKKVTKTVKKSRKQEKLDILKRSRLKAEKQLKDALKRKQEKKDLLKANKLKTKKQLERLNKK
tara:strand:+ start:1080 stop:1277 length:198 start_codon:yes stop_codon:yes gene_type:complete